MELRGWARTFVGEVLAAAVRDLNARHPWSHNDHFHSWIVANLPEQRHLAVDVAADVGSCWPASRRTSMQYGARTLTRLCDSTRRVAVPVFPT
jgi:hypothetical protein